MNDFIKNLINFGTENWLTLLTILVNLVITMINNKNNRVAEKKRQEFKKKIENLKNDNAHNIQVQEYFKKISTDKQSEILSEWVTFITDLNAFMNIFGDEEKFKNMKHDVVMYGSQVTVSLLASFLHYVYENSKNNPEYVYKGIVYTAFIIASLKYDFSGYLVNQMDFLRLQMKDFSHYSDKLALYFKQIKDETNISLFG